LRGRLDSCPSFAQVAREPRGFLPHHRELDTGTDQQLATNEFQQFPHEPAKDFGAVRPFELGKVGRRRVLRRQALLFSTRPEDSLEHRRSYWWESAGSLPGSCWSWLPNHHPAAGRTREAAMAATSLTISSSSTLLSLLSFRLHPLPVGEGEGG
jgi:hypothetical protein